jgi:type I restriction enzyme, R subunit
MDNIRMVGNSAVHGKKFKQLTTEETVKHISHLFLMYVWFERNYGSPSKDRSQSILFNPKLIPNADNTQQITANQEQLQKETEAKEKQFAEQIALIQDIQTVEYWKGITLPMLEAMRKRIRGLVKLIEKSTSTIVYSMLDDEIGEMQAVDIPVVSNGVNLAQYRKRVESFIKANEDHITIAKLKRGLALTPTDLSELERFVFEAQEVESRDKFEECFGTDKPLPLFIRSLVGLDRQAVQQAFSKYLQGSSYNEKQIRFIEMMIEHLTQNGVLDAAQLYEPPFNQIHYEGIDGVFADADADNIFGVVEAFNEAVA